MKKLLLILFLVGGATQFASAQDKHIFNETPQQKVERLKWWTDARFGMFIHWGLYSLAARHEWVKNHERLTNEQYQQYFDNFNPDEFDPVKWAKDGTQFVFWNAPAVVADGKLPPASLLPEVHFHGGFLRRVTNGVAHHIFYRQVQ